MKASFDSEGFKKIFNEKMIKEEEEEEEEGSEKEIELTDFKLEKKAGREKKRVEKYSLVKKDNDFDISDKGLYFNVCKQIELILCDFLANEGKGMSTEELYKNVKNYITIKEGERKFKQASCLKRSIERASANMDGDMTIILHKLEALEKELGGLTGQEKDNNKQNQEFYHQLREVERELSNWYRDRKNEESEVYSLLYFLLGCNNSTINDKSTFTHAKGGTQQQGCLLS